MNSEEYLLTGADGREWLLSEKDFKYFELRFAEYELMEVDDEPTLNMACDSSGICGGRSCPQYYQCQV